MELSYSFFCLSGCREKIRKCDAKIRKRAEPQERAGKKAGRKKVGGEGDEKGRKKEGKRKGKEEGRKRGTGTKEIRKNGVITFNLFRKAGRGIYKGETEIHV